MTVYVHINIKRKFRTLIIGKSYNISQPLIIEDAINSPILQEEGYYEYCLAKVVHPKFKLPVIVEIAKPHC